MRCHFVNLSGLPFSLLCHTNRLHLFINSWLLCLLCLLCMLLLLLLLLLLPSNWLLLVLGRQQVVGKAGQGTSCR